MLMPIPIAAAVPLIASGVSAVGDVIGGIFRRKQSKQDIADQNAYNHPLAQVRRLREAGLPMASLLGGAGTGTQGGVPEPADFSKVGSNTLSSYLTTQSQMKQLKLLDADIAKTEAEAQGQAILNQINTGDPMAGEPVSYLQRKARLDIETKQLESYIAKNNADIGLIDAAVKKDLHSTGTLSAAVRQSLAKLVVDTNINMQAERRGRIIDFLIKRMEQSGGKLTVAEALFHAIISGSFGPGNFIK